ncbi:MAG: gamma carbonic anhydrase family protein [Planctomycetota bacterium]|jgi:carbonic anhydrase/acetyltransferase-like protein (isoleucine patch superfamily)
MIKSLDGKTPKIADSACISQSAFIAGDVEIGDNSSVWPGAVIRADFGKIRIGNNTHIEDNCVLHGGNMEIGDNVIVGHGAVVQKLSARSEKWAHRGETGIYINLARKYMENGF